MHHEGWIISAVIPLSFRHFDKKTFLKGRGTNTKLHNQHLCKTHLSCRAITTYMALNLNIHKMQILKANDWPTKRGHCYGTQLLWRFVSTGTLQQDLFCNLQKFTEIRIKLTFCTLYYIIVFHRSSNESFYINRQLVTNVTSNPHQILCLRSR